MEIVENLARWQAEYEAGWLAHFRETGQINWDIYPRPKNKTAPAGPGINLSRSRLALISTAGAYLPDSQPPFDAANPLGDYSLRLFPANTPFEALALAHDHFDHTAIHADPQVLLPLQHLADLAKEGAIGEISPSVISFSGYQPDLTHVVNQLIPAVLAEVANQQANAALLVPA